MSEHGVPVKKIRLNSPAPESDDSLENDNHSVSSLDEDDASNNSSQQNSTDYTRDSEDESERSESQPQKKEIEDTPLHRAINAEDIDLIEEILDSGIDVDEPGKRNNTALHLAIYNKYLPAIKCLLEYGASISVTDKSEDYYNYWDTPLHIAVKEDRLDIVKMLCTIQVDVNKLMKNYDKVLSYAVKRKNYKIIKCLVGFSNHENENLRKRAFNIFSKQKLRVMGYKDNLIDSLFEKCIVMNLGNRNNDTPLILAVKNKNLDMIKYLLDNGSYINDTSYYHFSNGWTALHAAIDINDEDIVEFLLKNKDCDFNIRARSNGQTPVEIATSKNNLRIVKKLVDKISQHDEYGKDKFQYIVKAFHMAIEKNFTEITKYFLDTINIDVNMKTEKGESALGVAVNANQVNMAELLLDSGADINYYSENNNGGLHWGGPPLYCAVRKGNLRMVDLLLRRGAHINEEKITDTTILHLAVSSGNNEIVKRLLDLGVDVYSKRKTYPYDDMTPLLFATYKKSKEIFLTLFENGYNITDMATMNSKCVSIIDIALKERCGNDFLMMLLNLGADINDASINDRKLSEKTLKILERHLLKLKAAKLFVDKKFDAWISRAMENKGFYDKCKNEIKKLKTEKFYQLTICYYDLLINGVDRVAMYAENKTIEDALELDQLKIKFPLYAEMLICHFKRGQRRNQLLKSAGKILEDIFINLPYDCIIHILKYLTNEDLLRCLGKISDVTVDT